MRNNKRKYLLSLAGLSALIPAWNQDVRFEEEDRPNIIFILADDLRFDALGCIGGDEFNTPNIDKIGKQGVIFSNAYNTTAISMASRAQIMTGLYEFSTGCNFTHGDLSYDIWESSYPYLLEKAGYNTGFAGKFGFRVMTKDGRKGNVSTVSESFDYWNGWLGQGSYSMEMNKEAEEYKKKYGDAPEHTTFALGVSGCDFIEKYANQDQPFCLSVSFKAPHTPYHTDPRYNEVYSQTKFEESGNHGEKESLSPQALAGRPYSKGKSWMNDYQDQMKKYNTMVYGMDVAVGMILKELDKQGVSDNTVIIFTSDNGHFNGSKSLGGKLYAYEEGSKAPLLYYDPRLSENVNNQNKDALIGNIDMSPTILDLAGIEIPESYQGKSIIPILEGEIEENHESLMLINVWGTRAAQSLSVVTNDFKYIYWMYGAEGYSPVEELFDMNNDQLEQKNLVDNKKYKRELEEMQSKYDDYLKFWAAKSVDGKGYPKYVKIGDRHIPFDTHSMELLKTMYPDEEKSKNKANQDGDGKKASKNKTKTIKTKKKSK